LRRGIDVHDPGKHRGLFPDAPDHLVAHKLPLQFVAVDARYNTDPFFLTAGLCRDQAVLLDFHDFVDREPD
jgi:hypothetical protein